MKKIISVILSAMLVLSLAACGSAPAEEQGLPEENTGEGQEEVSEEVPADNSQNTEPVLSDEKYENAVQIAFTGNGATVNGKPAEESEKVSIGGEIVYYHDMDSYESGNPYGEGEKTDRHSAEEAKAHTLVTITEPGEYFITGKLKGQLAVDLGDEAGTDPEAKVTLIFGGANIDCEIAPAVIFYNVYECADEEINSEKADTSEAGANVIIADGSVNNINGSYVARIYKDNENEEKLHKYDGAFYSRMSMNVDGGSNGTGTVNITAENEGLDSEMHLTINGGNINITSEEDGINANEDNVSIITINGGNININAGLGKEGDGIDSNGWIVINGGDIYASANPRSADSGLDADNAIHINGGNLVSFGNGNDIVRGESAQTFVHLSFATGVAAGGKIEFIDADGKGIVCESKKDFRNVLLSSPELEKEKEYNLYLNGILQEYSSAEDPWLEMKNEFAGIMGMAIEQSMGGRNPNAVPEGFDEWLESAEDIPDDIRIWLETMAERSENEDKYMGRDFPDIKDDYSKREHDNMSLEEENDNVDRTVFIITDEYWNYSGIFDSSKATGKERVSFTVNGEKRFDDLYIGTLPDISLIECDKPVPEKDIVITVEYSGTDENISVSESCRLSEGYKKVNALFKDLVAGNYRLTLSVSSENSSYAGITVFNFDVVD